MEPDDPRDPASFPPTTSPSSPPGHHAAGEEWCEVLERFGLDEEQAEALTKVTAERATAWFRRWSELVPAEDGENALIPPPTHPDALKRGLALWKERNRVGSE